MNKNLAKIITICVLAVVIPVAIIVTAVCLSSAVTYSLTLAVDGYINNVGEFAVKVNGKEYKDALKFSKGQNITVEIESEGYNFVGWYEGETYSIEGDEAVSKNAKYTFKISENTNLTAVVDLVKYAVSYNGANATFVNYGAVLSNEYGISEEDQEKGVTFVGWAYKDANQREHVIADSTELNNAFANESGIIDLYAKTEVVAENITYYVSYDGKDDVKVRYGAALNNGDAADVADRYAFAGWLWNNEIVTNAEFGTTTNQISLTSKQAFLYTITFKNGNSETIKTVEDVLAGTKLLDGSDEDVFAAITEGKKFAGWKYGENKVESEVVDAEVFGEESHDITLILVEENVKYSISYDGKEATENVEYGTDLAGKEEANLTEGKKFTGWLYENEVVTKAEFGDKKHDAEISLTSKQEAIKYTITFKNGDTQVGEPVEVEYGAEITKELECTPEQIAKGDHFAGWLWNDEEVTTAEFGENQHEDAEVILTAKINNYYEDNHTYKSVKIKPNFISTVYDADDEEILVEAKATTYTTVYDAQGNAKDGQGHDAVNYTKKIIDVLTDRNIATVYDDLGNALRISAISINSESIYKSLDIDCTIEDFINEFNTELNKGFKYGEDIEVIVTVEYEIAE